MTVILHGESGEPFHPTGKLTPLTISWSIHRRMESGIVMGPYRGPYPGSLRSDVYSRRRRGSLNNYMEKVRTIPVTRTFGKTGLSTRKDGVSDGQVWGDGSSSSGQNPVSQ